MQGIPNHTLHVAAVGIRDATTTSYLESPFSLQQSRNNGKDMNWGGGAIIPFESELSESGTGGLRNLGEHRLVRTVDLVNWILNHTTPHDYVVLKLDVEGSEFEILNKLLDTRVMQSHVDKLYLEIHFWAQLPSAFKAKVVAKMVDAGIKPLEWAAEVPLIQDISHRTESHGIEDRFAHHHACEGDKHITLVLNLGMSRRSAERLVKVLADLKLPKHSVLLCLYGEFVESFPTLVLEWRQEYKMCLRGSSRLHDGEPVELRSVMNAARQFATAGLQPRFFSAPVSSVWEGGSNRTGNCSFSNASRCVKTPMHRCIVSVIVDTCACDCGIRLT